MTRSSILVGFDFDHTVIDANSDTYIRQLIPDGKVPQSVINVFKETNSWTSFMAATFRYLRYECDVQPKQLLDCVAGIELAPGMQELLTFLQSQKDTFECIVISDANSVFIDKILSTRSFERVFSQIFTNPAYFDNDGMLCISPFHHQTECILSAENLCKGKVLTDYISQRHSAGKSFSTIAFIGDGSNDFCPVLSLKENDLAFARAGHVLDSAIQKNKDEQPLAAQLVTYESGNEIINVLKTRM